MKIYKMKLKRKQKYSKRSSIKNRKYLKKEMKSKTTSVLGNIFKKLFTRHKKLKKPRLSLDTKCNNQFFLMGGSVLVGLMGLVETLSPTRRVNCDH